MKKKRLICRRLEACLKKPLIVCLCGSTRFKETFEHYNKTLTCDGHIVLSVGSYAHYDGDMKEIEVSGIKGKLDNLHLRKIDLCDWVFVLNVGGYIGESTRREIEYAEKIGREVKYLEPIKANEVEQ